MRKHDLRWKNYLRNLPEDLPQKLPVYDKTSAVVMLYPIFQEKGIPSNYHKLYVKSTLWNMWSYIQNSNVVEEGIPLKFYIQDHVFEEEFDYLKRQGITESDCIIFENRCKREKFHSGHVNLALKLYPFLDKRLADYEKVFINDADMFLCKTEFATSQFNVQEFVNLVPVDKIGIKSIAYRDNIEDRSNWLNKFKNSDTSLFFEAIKMLGVDKLTQLIQSVNGSFYIYSPRHLSSTFLSYLEKAIPILRDDELVISVYNMSNPVNVRIVDAYISGNTHMSYARTEKDIIRMLDDKIHFYFSHWVASAEYNWRCHIGDN